MYDVLKHFDDKFYTGMTVGGTHLWDYKNGKWWEVKASPDQWLVQFNSIKYRSRIAPENSGAKVNTKFHWFILADQIATKLDANSYLTTMRGLKFKIGHQRPNWQEFSYSYPGQESYRKRLIRILEGLINQLKQGDYGEDKRSQELIKGQNSLVDAMNSHALRL